MTKQIAELTAKTILVGTEEVAIQETGSGTTLKATISNVLLIKGKSYELGSDAAAQSHTGVATGYIIRTNYYDSNRILGSGGMHARTATAIVSARASGAGTVNWPYTNGLFYDQLGQEFKAVETNGSVSVLMFGAVGDGVTDDYLSIQAALNITQASGQNATQNLRGLGGTISFPRGKYYVSQTLLVTNLADPATNPGVGQTITLQGSGVAKLQATQSYTPTTEIVSDQAIWLLTLGSAVTFTHAGPNIRDIGFTDTSASSDTLLGGIRIYEVNMATITDCSFRNITIGAGIFCEDEDSIFLTVERGIFRRVLTNIHLGATINPTIRKCHVIGGSLANVIGINMDGAGTIRLLDNSFDEVANGIICGSTDTARNLVIRDNRFETCTLAVQILKAESGVMTGNFFHGNNTNHWSLVNDASNRNWQIFHNMYGGFAADISKVEILLASTTTNKNRVNEPDLEFVEDVLRFNTLADGELTPDVSFHRAYITANTNPTSITDFDGRLYSGKRILIITNDTNTTFVHNAAVLLTKTEANITGFNDEIFEFVYTGAKWTQL